MREDVVSSGLRVEGLSVEYAAKRGLGRTRGDTHKALADVGFILPTGQTLGVVGESGSGKTTLGHAVLRMTPVSRGRILWDGVDLATLSDRDLRPYRRQMQLVFQDPYEAMNPRMSIGRIIAEPLLLAYGLDRHARREQALRLLKQVGLDESLLGRRPRALSGGQRQRVTLARALATAPRLLVLDEPTSGLDVSLQARVLNLLRDLQTDKGLSYLFISHDLAAVAYIAQRLLVLFQGRVMEQGPTDALLRHPAHPYTAALLAAQPSAVPGRAPKDPAPAMNPVADPVPGACVYYQWCGKALPRCRTEAPDLTSLGADHLVACHYPGHETTSIH